MKALPENLYSHNVLLLTLKVEVPVLIRRSDQQLHAENRDSAREILRGHVWSTASLRKAALLPAYGTDSSCRTVTTYQTFIP
jgi:hypothetical protein